MSEHKPCCVDAEAHYLHTAFPPRLQHQLPIRCHKCEEDWPCEVARLQAERDTAKARVGWFEKAGGVTMGTRVFQEVARAEKAEERVKELEERVRFLFMHHLCIRDIHGTPCPICAERAKVAHD